MVEEFDKDEKILSDARIIDLYWSRDESAIDETDKKYGRYLYTIAYNIVHDEMDSEECLNDTYLDSWNKIPPTRPEVLGGFLSKIIRNIAVDKFRKKTAQKRIPANYTVPLSELEECLSDELCVDEDRAVEEIGRILNDWISTLSKRREIIFVCRYYYSDSVASIAEMMKLSESTVFRELATMRQELKEAIEKEGYTL